MSSFIWLLLDKDSKVIAVYSDADLAANMKPHVEKKLNLTLTIERRSVNQDIKRVGEEK